MFFFFPYQVDVPMQRLPLANLFLIAATVVISVLAMMDPEGMLRDWVLWRDENFRVYQLLTNLFVHAGILHLVGNLIFLFTFGNAINAKLGHWQFLSLYLGIGLLESLLWYMTGPGQASLGASGAIMGVVGMFLILYPRNDVTCFWMFFLRIGTFSISSYWLILLYILFDVWGLASAQGGTNYVAHVGGMVMGVGVIAGLVMAGLIRSEPTEENLLEILGWVKKEPPVPSGAGLRDNANGAGGGLRDYVVHGADRETGFTTSFAVRAASEAEARMKASQEGVVATDIEVGRK